MGFLWSEKNMSFFVIRKYLGRKRLSEETIYKQIATVLMKLMIAENIILFSNAFNTDSIFYIYEENMYTK